MRSDAPTLLPVLRSRVQARLLAELLLHPRTELTLTALADRIGAPLSTVYGEVSRLTQAGILVERSVGRARLYKANAGNPIVRPLTDLIALTFGPLTAVRDEFTGIVGVEQVVLFGSWAARYTGEPGPPPNDVDVLIVGRPERAAVYEAADRVERVVGAPVNPVVVSQQRFAKASDPLLREILARPHVVVDPPEEPG